MGSECFACPSLGLSLSVLLSRTRKVGYLALAGAAVAHLCATQMKAASQEQRTAKPLTTQFVKRAPRLTKPLELKKRPQPKRRAVQREMVAVKARMQAGERIADFQPTQVLRGLARPSTPIGRIAASASEEVGPRTIAGAIEGTKDVEQKLDMSLELLDIGALNTGQYHAMVIQDPEDKRNLKGFCRLSYLFIPRLHETVVPNTAGLGTAWYRVYVGGAVRNLVDAMNEYTSIETRVGEKLVVTDPEVFRTPWIYLLFFARGYTLSDLELDVLGRYLMQGGFIFADSHPEQSMSVASSHQRNLLAMLERQGMRPALEILPNTHPVYHCYFDFAGPPDAADGLSYRCCAPGTFEHPGYVEGLEIDGRLVAILSRKGYYHPWHNGSAWEGGYPVRQLQFGVNLIVFALTQEGSITRRLMDSVK